jgi:hypothetical protein
MAHPILSAGSETAAIPELRFKMFQPVSEIPHNTLFEGSRLNGDSAASSRVAFFSELSSYDPARLHRLE